MLENTSRRSFVKGATLGVLGAGVAGAAISTAAPALASEATSEAIAWDDESDVLVIGSGFAGLCAAISATEAGCSVTIVEKNTICGGNSIQCGGNAQFGGGNVIQQAAGIEDTPERFFTDMYKWGEYRAAPEVLRNFADNANECVEWLIDDVGLVFSDSVSIQEDHTVPCTLKPAESDLYPGTMGLVLWDEMYAKVTELGINVLIEHKVTKLLQNDEGVVIGARIEADGTTKNFKAHKGVILCGGGWKSNVGMRTNYDPRLNADVYASGLPYVETTGEMMNEAVEIGAGFRDMSYVCEYEIKWGTPYFRYWDPVSYDNPVTIVTGISISDFNDVVIVQNDGTRFVDENTASYAKQSFIDTYLDEVESPRNVWAIVDSTGAENLGWNTSYFDNPVEGEMPYLSPERVAVADTISELADKIGVSADNLDATINTYNGYVSSGLDEEFGKEGMTIPVENGPFYAVKLRLFAHDQMGGLVANTKAQVCKRSEHYGPDEIALDDQEVIPHLYAAGECVGGYFGVNRGHGKISCYMFYGKTAGENAAKEDPVD